jgi:hypothetical protein
MILYFIWQHLTFVFNGNLDHGLIRLDDADA